MKNKKGFTLVELLAVIAILAVLAVIAVPSYNAVSKNIKQKMRDSKIETIATAAELWAQDHKNSCGDITIDQLLDGYIKADDKSGKIKDPVTGEAISSLEEIGINMQDICKNVTGTNIGSDTLLAGTDIESSFTKKEYVPQEIIDNYKADYYYETWYPAYATEPQDTYIEVKQLPTQIKGKDVTWSLDCSHDAFKIENNILYAQTVDRETCTLTATTREGLKWHTTIANFMKYVSIDKYQFCQGYNSTDLHLQLYVDASSFPYLSNAANLKEKSQVWTTPDIVQNWIEVKYTDELANSGLSGKNSNYYIYDIHFTWQDLDWLDNPIPGGVSDFLGQEIEAGINIDVDYYTSINVTIPSNTSSLETCS